MHQVRSRKIGVGNLCGDAWDCPVENLLGSLGILAVLLCFWKEDRRYRVKHGVELNDGDELKSSVVDEEKDQGESKFINREGLGQRLAVISII